MRQLALILLLVSASVLQDTSVLAAPVAATGSRGEALSETGAKSPESGMSRRLTMSGSASPLAASTVTEDPTERQMIDIAKGLRCAVCQNQPVSESNADLARDMRAIILDQLKQGKSREEIVQYFVARYGDYVLMNPPTRGPGLLLWVLPAGVLGLLGITAFMYLRHRRSATLPPTPTLTAADRKRVEKARKDESDA